MVARDLEYQILTMSEVVLNFVEQSACFFFPCSSEDTVVIPVTERQNSSSYRTVPRKAIN